MFDYFWFALLVLCLRFDAIHAIVGGSTETDTESRPPRTQQAQHLYRGKPFEFPFPPGFYVIHPEQYLGLLPKKDSEWFVRNIPFLEFPADPDLLTAYYYRWRLYKKHIRFVPEINMYVVTEFLPEVPWAGEYNTIPAAAGHHIMEGRWIHDETILNDYIRFWFSDTRGMNKTARGHGANSELLGNPNLSTYTNWIGHAAWQRYVLNGNATFVTFLLESLATTFREVYVPKYLKQILWNASNSRTINNTPDSNTTDSNVNPHVLSCWWQNDGYDAMEVSISGSGCRPTIASAMYGEADTVVKVSNLVADGATSRELRNEFTHWRELSRNLILDYHWNPEIQSFAVIPTVFDGDEKHNADRDVGTAGSNSNSNSNCDLSSVRVPNRTVQVRELLAFCPWYFDSLIPHHRTAKYLPMWKQLLDPNGFAGEWGLRTAELRHPCYNYSYDHGDCWNGPSWPYETARVLTGLANLLNRNASTIDDSLSSENYYDLLLQYARQHTKTFAINDTAVPKKSGHIFENLHADLGYWNNRQQMYQRNDVNKNMGDDYNHSSFIDLVLNGLMGIRPQEDASILHVHPMVPPSVIGFAVDHVKVWGKIVSIVWDRDGRMYKNFDQGLTVLVDGEKVAHSSTMELLVIPMNAAISTL